MKVAVKNDLATKEDHKARMIRKAEKAEGKINLITAIKMGILKIVTARERTMMNVKKMVVSKVGMEEMLIVASE